MLISLIDRSLYYKSLMLLIRKDREVHDEEKRLMLNIGKILGFDLDFCKKTIEEIVKNKNIIDSPPLFSVSDIALCFIRDGMRLSAVDGHIDDTEIAWLKSVADRNGLSHLWAEELERFHQTKRTDNQENNLELQHFRWE